MKMETKKEVFGKFIEEYYRAKFQEKGGKKSLTKIIDTVKKVTGLQRKSVIRFFNRRCAAPSWKEVKETRGRPLSYTTDVTEALKKVWEAGGEVCGELLHPVVPEYVKIFKRDQMWELEDLVTNKLLTMSLGTMKNRVSQFSKERRKGRGLASTQSSQLKYIIPIFHGDWNLKLPGTGQIDTVVHCGHSLTGNMAFTLNYIDVATLWDISRAQWNKGKVVTKESLVLIKKFLPWPMLEVHPDTGSEFINWYLKTWCDINNIKMSRSRPNHSNDNMHVEERNGHIIRKYIGYGRLDCREAVEALNDIYAVLGPYLNHFVASRRVIEKYEVNGKWKKRYEPVAKTPYQRVLENTFITDEVKEKLKKEHEKLNPLIMKREIDRLKKVLYDIQKKHGTTEF